MEMRSLTRCLRSRPTATSTSMLSSRIPRTQTASFSSSSTLYDENQSQPHPQSRPQPQQRNRDIRLKNPDKISNILDQLNLRANRSNARAPTSTQLLDTQARPQRFRNRDANATTTTKTTIDPSNPDAAATANATGTPEDAAAANLATLNAASRASFTDIAKESRQTRRALPGKLNPALGRRVPVSMERGENLEMSMFKLNRLLTDNNVKFQHLQQKYHVRRGQLKKNLRIKRWRKLFQYSMQHTVSKIKRMRAQGW
ncbi:mitochondrial 37S ribosomal protein bS21m [Aspergillus stella-maris]|uniref:mitochondrial 37S ribosomal protein bS21m n=1 Tax=Aspergillus stella-maris TaxID=1810926 RepID=UPI003CCCAC02